MENSDRTIKSDSYIRTAIVQLLALKLRSGSSSEDARTLALQCVDEASKSLMNFSDRRGLDIHHLGSILRTWHKDPKYLTEDGLPRRLRISGRVSLRSLAKIFYPPNKFNDVFAKLRSSKLIAGTSRLGWTPTDRHALISRLSLETLEHLSEGVARYVETVTRNVNAQRDDEVLFERSCKVRQLPKKHLQDFRMFVSQQAISFISGMDDWLETRNLSEKIDTKNTVTAGVYTFAYVDPMTKRRRR